MPPPSLRQLCTTTAIRLVKYLNDIGNIPYALARPFLVKIESPEKLRSIEVSSPHIMKDDAELWMEFIKRDIPGWEEYDLPGTSGCWYDIYCDLREQVQREVDEDAEKLKMALDGINSERAKHTSKFVTDKRSLPLPRERPGVKHRYSSFDRKTGGSTLRFASFASAVRTPSRRDLKKRNNIFTATRMNPMLAVPTKQLTDRASQIKNAPRSLIEEHRSPAEHPGDRRNNTGSPNMIAPGRSKLLKVPGMNSRRQLPSPSSSLLEKEARQAKSPARFTDGRGSTSDLFDSASDKASERPTWISSDGSFPTQPAETTRPLIVRKRPAPRVFIEPKKKRIT